jgi:preprotein translocase SecE subunit
MPSRQRYVVIGVIALAAIVGLALSHGLQWIWGEAGLNDPFFGSPDFTLTTFLGYGAAIAGAVFVLRHGPTHALAVEIVDELARVTWPSREETGNATVVVIVTVLVCSAYLGVFDAIWLWVTDMILGVRVATPG